MSRRIRRGRSNRVTTGGYAKHVGDMEVAGKFINPEFEELRAQVAILRAVTTVPAVPSIGNCYGIFKGIVIHWDIQHNLTVFDRYELQVSDDDATWYSLETDGTDWKDTLNADTDVRPALYVHHPIPFGGTEESPTAVTLYYRVRRVTLDGTASAWSSSASAATLLVDTGDVAANAVTAGKVTAAEFNVMLANVYGMLTISDGVGFIAGAYGTPVNGNERIVMDNDELFFERYVGAPTNDWVEKIRIGNVDGAGNDFKSEFREEVRVYGESGASGASKITGAVVVLDADNTVALQFLTPNTEIGEIAFGDPQDGDVGLISYSHAVDRMSFRAGTATVLELEDDHVDIKKQLEISGASRVAAYRSTAQSIPNATWTTVIFTAEEFDNLSEYNTSTGVFTANAAGYYLVSARVLSTSRTWAIGEEWICSIYKNSSYEVHGTRWHAHAAHSDYADSQVAAVVYLAASDTIAIRVRHTQGAAINTHADADYMRLNIHRLS